MTGREWQHLYWRTGVNGAELTMGGAFSIEVENVIERDGGLKASCEQRGDETTR